MRNCIYPYEYKDSWERFNEESLPDKESFYNELYKENITDEEYEHGQKVWKVFKIKDLGEYHDLMFREILHYLQMCLKILEINA